LRYKGRSFQAQSATYFASIKTKSDPSTGIRPLSWTPLGEKAEGAGPGC
jgi:hypothetical protein